MQFPFFGRRAGKQERDSRIEESIVPAKNADLVPVFDNETVDLSLYEHVTLDVKSVGGKTYIDSLVPMISAAVDAASQWNHAVVRFPGGYGWNDLMNRKTPGWEGLKQLGIRKNGKIQAQAAIRQAKLQPAAVANLALQGAAIVVGQVYMTEISKQLEGIESGIAAIQQEMSLEREAGIEARFEKLCEYLALFDEISTNSEKRQAVLNEIEGIRVDALEAWKLQIKSMDRFAVRVGRSKRMKDDEVRDRLAEFQSKERAAQAAFRLLSAAEQASMQYDGDFSSARIGRERARLDKCLDEYASARGKAQGLLMEKIKGVRGDFLALPIVDDDEYKPQNPLFDAAHFIARNVPRVTPLALRKEAQEQAAEKRDRYRKAAKVEDPIALLGDECFEGLQRVNFIYNEADAMLIDAEGIHFVKTTDKVLPEPVEVVDEG